MASDVHKYKIPLSCCWQNCYSSPSESGFKDQQLAGSNVERSGLQIYQVSDFKESQPVMRAKEPMIGSHCHPATITTARGRKAHFFLSYNWVFPLSPPDPPPHPINNASEEYDLFLWGFWMAPNIFLEAKYWRASPVCQLLRLIRRWHCWLTLQSCSTAKERGAPKIHQLPKWEENSFILAHVSFAKNNLVSSN